MFTTILGLLLFMLVVVGIYVLVRFLRWRNSDLKEPEGGKHLPLSDEQKQAMHRARLKVREDYLDALHISWYQIVIIFVVGSMAGLLLEETWMYFTAHLTESRVGLVWGPFSPLYGFGAVLLTIITFRLRRSHPKLIVVFLVSVLVGGTLEQVTGWGMEHIFHMESWTYQYLPDHITKYIAWRFLFFWGLLGLVWYKFVMPNMLYMIGAPTTRRSVAFVSLLAVYLSLDIFMTLAVFNRMVQRDEGVPAHNAFDRYLDDNYSNTWIKDRFQNLVVETAPRESDKA